MTQVEREKLSALYLLAAWGSSSFSTTSMGHTRNLFFSLSFHLLIKLEGGMEFCFLNQLSSMGKPNSIVPWKMETLLACGPKNELR